MVMFGGLGTVVGATYAPPFEINPCVESPLLGVASAISQNTFWSIVPFTVAVNVCDPPLFNETVAGATITMVVVCGGVTLLQFPVPLQEIKYGKIASLATREIKQRNVSIVP